jgi:hypothetical protein
VATDIAFRTASEQRHLQCHWSQVTHALQAPPKPRLPLHAAARCCKATAATPLLPHLAKQPCTLARQHCHICTAAALDHMPNRDHHLLSTPPPLASMMLHPYAATSPTTPYPHCACSAPCKAQQQLPHAPAQAAVSSSTRQHPHTQQDLAHHTLDDATRCCCRC